MILVLQMVWTAFNMEKCHELLQHPVQHVAISLSLPNWTRESFGGKISEGFYASFTTGISWASCLVTAPSRLWIIPRSVRFHPQKMWLKKLWKRRLQENTRTYQFSVEFSKMAKRQVKGCLLVFKILKSELTIFNVYIISIGFGGGKFMKNPEESTRISNPRNTKRQQESPRKPLISNPSSVQNIDSKPITHGHPFGRVQACETRTAKASIGMWLQSGGPTWRFHPPPLWAPRWCYLPPHKILTKIRWFVCKVLLVRSWGTVIPPPKNYQWQWEIHHLSRGVLVNSGVYELGELDDNNPSLSTGTALKILGNTLW